MMGKVDIAVGKMVEKVDRLKNTQFIEFINGFRADLGRDWRLSIGNLCYHLLMKILGKKIHKKSVTKIILIICMSALLLGSLVPFLSLLATK